MPWLAAGSGEPAPITLSRAISLPISVSLLSSTLVTENTPLTSFAFFIRVLLIWLGVQDGFAWMMSAIAPKATPAAIEVPLTLKYEPSVMQTGHSDTYALPGERVETM